MMRKRMRHFLRPFAKAGLRARNRKLIEVDAHINDPAFAAEAVKQFKAIV